MRHLSLLENCRRLAVATTSGSGRIAPEGAFPSAPGASSKAPSGAVSCGDSIIFAFDFFMILTCIYTLISEGQVSQVILAQGGIGVQRQQQPGGKRRQLAINLGPLGIFAGVRLGFP